MHEWLQLQARMLEVTADQWCYSSALSCEERGCHTYTNGEVKDIDMSEKGLERGCESM
jgi:hypothetical protein